MGKENKCTVKRLAQIGILVEDVEKAVHTFETILGIGPWRYDDLHMDSAKGDQVDGHPSDLWLKGAFCNSLGPDLELIQPVSDGQLKQWLEKHGPGLHHLGFETDEGFETALCHVSETSGKKTWFRGELSGGMKFAYFDLAKELGSFVELFGGPKDRFPSIIEED